MALTMRPWVMSLGMVLAAIGATPVAAATCQLAKYLDLPVVMRGPRPIVSAQIDGKDAHFLLDSGAFWSMMPPAVATQFGVRLGSLPAGLRVHGIAGNAVDTSLASVKNFGLGQLTLPRVDFLVGGTDPGTAGLLGQNFLHIGDVEYDLPHGAVRLMKATGCKPGQYIYWAGNRPVPMVELRSDGWSRLSQTIGPVIVNGVKLEAVFDSGAPSSIMTLAAARKAGLTPTTPGVTSADYASGIGRGTTKAWTGTFASIDIGGEAIRNPRMLFADIELGGSDMLIGIDFFLTHRIYVSNAQQKMFFTYEGGPIFGLKPTGEVLATGERVDLTDKSDAPTDAEGFARRGSVAASNGREDDAIGDFAKAIALDPRQGRYYRQRAAVRMSKHQGMLAVSDLDKAIELDPSDMEARLMRASVHLAAHDADGALEDLRAADARLPASAGQRLMIGALADAAGHPELALLQYDAWLASHSEDARRAEALNGRCWARAQLDRDLAAALGDCNAALKLRRADPAILDSRALVYFRQNNLKAALVDYDAAIQLRPDMSWTLYARGLVKAKLGDAAGAKADRDAALKIDAHLPERARHMGLEG